ncbi:MAG: ribose-phosphate pyrophosphokinase [Armatimonadetes bacterium]|nr:ribose-phosphate pyrophosphokinase [Armatimonadota bacterium]
MAARYVGYKLVAGTSNPRLCQAIADYLHQPLCRWSTRRFTDGEIFVKGEENMRGADVFVLQPTGPPVNDNLMELLIVIDALKRASAERITAVVPYYGYARQEKKDAAREPITARLVADMIEVAGADRLVTIDLHAGAIQGFFNIPIDHLTVLYMVADYFRSSSLEKSIVVAPDTGRAKAAEKLADALDLPMAVLHKHRPRQQEAEVTHIAGELKGLRPIVFEDIVSTGGTLAAGIDAMLAAGCEPDIRIAVTHPLLTGNAIAKLDRPEVSELVVTDTVPLTCEQRIEKITVLSVASLLGETIRRIHHGESVSALFDPHRGANNPYPASL